MHTLGFGPGRTSAGLGRTAEVSAGVAEIQGLESGSSPTSGTVGLFGCVGERLPTADRVPPCGVSSGCSSSFVLPSGFRVRHFMEAKAAYNMTC